MNKNLHRIIFNAARGARMVVQETARSAGKAASGATSAPEAQRPLAPSVAAQAGAIIALSASLFALPLSAQIANDPSAPGNQRPTVLVAPNGVPLVNVQTPSAAGVSRNSYRQFDVDGRGAILNNSGTAVQTQLGGFVQGNPWLGRGPARIILNEVNSTNPSYLRGYVEVAGQRADVIVANPAGIQVNGGGFINTNRATLTTGTPQFNATGGLDSFLVRGGTVRIEGAGLDARQTDYTAILARAVQVNAGIWAHDLKVVAGANTVAADASSATLTTGSGAAPAFALDVAQLGGMYAGKIHLVGTEAGVGVRSAGSIGAGAGGLIVTSAGRLENVGTLEGPRIELASASDIMNRGGTIRQTGSAALGIQASNLSNTNGGVIGAEPLASAPAPTDGSGSAAESGGSTLPPAPPAGGAGAGAAGGSGNEGVGGAPAPAPAAPPAPGLITAAGTIHNEGGRIYAGGDLQLQMPNIDNSGGQLSVGELNVSGPRFANAGGTLNVARSFTAQVGSFDNLGGTVDAGALNIDVQGGDLDNRQGTLHSNSDVRVQVAGQLLNANGVVSSTGSLGATVQGRVDNTAGQLVANEGLELRADALDNVGGTVVQSGAQALRVAMAATLNNSAGRISGHSEVILEASSLGNQGGQIQAGNEAGSGGAGNLSVRIVGTLDNSQSGKLAASGDVALNAQELDNTSGEVAATGQLQVSVAGTANNAQGSLSANRQLSLDAGTLNNSGGSIGSVQGDVAVRTQGQTVNSGGKLLAGGALSLANAGLDNTNGQASGRSVSVATRGGALVNARGTLGSSQGPLAIQSGALNNDAGRIQSAGDLRLDTQGQALSNRNAAAYPGQDADGQPLGGGIISGAAMTVLAGALDNSAGFIGAQGDLLATTGAVLNADSGQIGSNAALTIDTQGSDFDNRGGRTQAQGDLRVDAGRIDNSGALLRSGGTATLNAGQELVNRDTLGTNQGIEATNLRIQTPRLDNTRGAIRAAQDATIVSDATLDNTAGLISAQRDLSVQGAQSDQPAADPASKTLAVINTGGTLVANQDLHIDAAGLTGDGTTTAGRDLEIALTQDVMSNVDVSAGRNLSYTTTGQFTNNAKLRAGETLTVRGDKGIDNTASGELSGTDTIMQTDGVLNNQGLIDAAGHTQIDVGEALNNTGGRIYGDRISISAAALNNAPAVEGGTSGSIASRTGDIDLGIAGHLNNDGGEILSGAGLYVGGALDEYRMATGRAQQVTNLAGTIESAGDMVLGAQRLDNLNRGFSTKEVTTTEEGLAISLLSFPGVDGRFSRDELGQCFKCVSHREDSGAEGVPRAEWVVPSAKYPFSKGYARHPYVLPSGGGTYAIDDPVWALFEVAPGDSGALDGALRAYNADFMGRAYRDYTEFFTTSRQTTQTVVDNAGTPGRIASGGDMTLDIGSGRNVNSQVIAGGVLGGNADSLVNEGAPGTKTVVDSGLHNTYAIQYDPYGKLKYKGGGTFSDTHSDSIDVTTAVKVSAPTSIPGKKLDRAQLGQASASASGTGAAGNAGRGGAVYEVAAAVGGAGGPAGAVIRTSAPSSTLPTASLFAIKSSGSYLIETDPRFANYRAWLSSDYLLSNLGLDPQYTLKRLGDGFYEQKLIREQVAQLTGQRYLDGYRSDEEMYTALLNAGATFARQFQLTPGVGLTATQMAQLTSDIVWLVEQEVTLPDGSVQKVLVPQLYVRVKEGDIQGNGALIAARSVDLKVTGNLTSQDGATIAGRTALKIDAGSIDVLNGARIHGSDVQLKTREDLNVIGARVTADNSLNVSAGRDLNVVTTTRSDSATGVGYTSRNTHIDRVAGLYVSGDGKGTLVASAGGDANIIGAVIANQGSGGTTVKAGRDLNLGTVTTESASSHHGKPGNSGSVQKSQEVGSQVLGSGVSLIADNDINIRQGSVDAQEGLLYMQAGKDINIEAGRQVTDVRAQVTGSTKSALLAKTTTTNSVSVHEDKAQVSLLNGGLVSVIAGGKVTSEGTTISGRDGVYISGADGVDLHEARDYRSETRSSQSKTSGPSTTGIGNTKQSSTTTTTSNTAVKGKIHSGQGGITITGHDASVAVQGVDLSAQGDVSVRGGGGVSITGATNYAQTTTETRSKGEAFLFGVHDGAEGWGSKKNGTSTQSQSELVRTELSGANIELSARRSDGSVGDVLLAGTTLTTPGTLKVEAGKLLLATQTSETSTSSTEQKRDLVYQKMKDSGSLDQDTHYVQINAGQLDLSKTHQITADLGAKDSVEQLAQQPGMAWASQLITDPSLKDKVDWNRVEEAHEKWNYKQQGLTPEGAAIVTAVVTYLTWGAASGAGTAVGNAAAVGAGEGIAVAGATFTTAAGATISTVVGGAVTAGLSTLAAQAAVALANNQGNLGKALDELGSSQSVKNLLTAVVTGGALGGLNLNPTGLPTAGEGASGFMNQLGTNLTAGVAKAVISTAINGGSLEQGLEQGLLNAFLDTVAAQGAFGIGTNIKPGSVANMLAHAMAGCAVGAAREGGSCGAGALGAAIGELTASLYDPGALNIQGDTVQFAAMMGSLAAGLAGLDAAEINQAGQAGANAAANNWLATKQVELAKQELAAAKTPLEALQVAGKWAAIGVKQDALTATGVGLGLAQSGIDDIQGMAQFLANPVEGLKGIKQLISSDAAREQFGDSVFRELDAKIDRMQLALAEGGDQNALQLGKDLGGLIYQLGSVVTGVGAAAKGGVAVANAAATLGAKTLESAALQFMKLDAGAIKGFKSAEEVNAMMKAADGWSPAWKPGTSVAEATINPGTTVKMVVSERQWALIRSGEFSEAFGGWATFDNVPDMAYARNQLALTDGMKSTNSPLYVLEVKVNKPINAQVGVVGEQGVAAGGGNQLHFFVPRGERSSVFSYVAGSGRALQ